MLGKDFAIDRNGCAVFVGDYVKYVSREPLYKLERGDSRRVQRIDGHFIEIAVTPVSYWRSIKDPVVFSLADAHKFEVCARYHSAHKGANNMKYQKETNPMSKPLSLYTAVLVFEGEQYVETVERINEKSATIMADTSYENLKRKVEERIRANPTEQWAISGATVIAQISAPPVTFRQL